MEKQSVITTSTNPQNDEPMLPSYVEDSVPEYVAQPKKGIPLSWVIIAILVIMLIMNSIQLHQYKQYSELAQQEAYLISASIYMLEENFLFSYGIFPEDLGIANLRQAWLDNACYETAMPYYEALKEAWEYFENDAGMFESVELILV